MKVLCVFGRDNYGDPQRGQGYEYTNFLPALRALGHEVHFFESLDKNVYADYSALNRTLLEEVSRIDPDVVFCVLFSYEIWLETLNLVRSFGVCLINWGTDDSWKYPQFSRYLAGCFDLWATTSRWAYEQALADGFDNFHLTQWAANSASLAEPLPAQACRYSVSFLGSAYGNRPGWVASLRRQGVEVACFGHGWPSGAVSAREIPHILRESVISLNFADSGLHLRGFLPFRSRQIKARVFEVPGAGGFLLTEPAEGLDEYFELGREIDTFSDADDLAARIRHYLDHPQLRDTMAMAAHRRTAVHHIYEVRLGELLERAKERHRLAGRRRNPLDFQAFSSAATRHSFGRRERFMRWLISLPLCLIWGRTRGKRAARRLLFELSWRIAGRRTYMAAGWPGRLFYKES